MCSDEIQNKNIGEPNPSPVACVSMNTSQHDENAFAFHLDAIHGKYLYFRAISIWSQCAKHGRDIRRPSPVIVDSFGINMDRLGQEWRWVRSEPDVSRWLKDFGWMLTPAELAKKRLACLLKSQTCLKSPLGLFWDVAIARNRAKNRRIKDSVRQSVLDRDGHRCIECHKTENDGVELTMDHVIPFSRGGETTEGNLVTLCATCNQGHGNQHHPHLFALAGLHHGWDPTVLGFVSPATNINDVLNAATRMSQNIMVSRCKARCIIDAGCR